jgi:UDP-glucose 4-epimerase
VLKLGDSFDWTAKSVLVTGGAGFIGSHLVELLVEAGANVTVWDMLSTGRRDNLAAVADSITLTEADVCVADWQGYLAEQPTDVIFHFAANAYVPPSVESPSFDCETNFAPTFRLLDDLRQMQWPGRMVFASSAAVYGNPVRVPIREEDPTVPISPYGAGKLAAERYLAVFARLYGLKLASVRFFSAYGPRQRKQVIFDLLTKMSNDHGQLLIHGDGTQVRDFLYVKDAALSAMTVAAEAELGGEAYNVGAGREYTIATVVKSLCDLTGLNPELRYTGTNRPGDPESLVVDIAKLELLGYRPRFEFEEGLATVLTWFEELTGETWMEVNTTGHEGDSNTADPQWFPLN